MSSSPPVSVSLGVVQIVSRIYWFGGWLEEDGVVVEAMSTAG